MPTTTAALSDRSPSASSRPAPRRGLVAVRRAGARFDGPFDLRPERAASTFDAWNELRQRLEEDRERLVDVLYHAVPEARDKKERRRILKLKRAVYNGRPLPDDLGNLQGDLAEQIAEHRALQEKERHFFSDTDLAETDLLADLRERIDRITVDPRFRRACRYSSPALYADLEASSEDEDASTSLRHLDRGVSAYATKFLAKANPLHLFAEIALVDEEPSNHEPSNHKPSNHLEITLDAKALLALERRLLDAHDRGELDLRDDQVFLEARPHRRVGDVTRFWVPEESGGFRVETLDLGSDPASSSRTEKLLEAFEEDSVLDLATWRQRVDFDGPVDNEPLDERLEEWIERGLVARHLFGDFLDRESLARELSAIDWKDLETSDLARAAEIARRRHLRRIDSADLEATQSELFPVGQALDVEPGFYVETPARLDDAERDAARRAGEIVTDDLEALAPVFAALPNTDLHGRVIRAYLRDALARVEEESGVARAPYFDLLRHFLRHSRKIVSTYRNTILESDEHAERLAWRRRLAAHAGALAPAQVRRFADEVSLTNPPANPPTSLCWNGPFDFSEDLFYPTNVFAGHGRFLGRYRLAEGRRVGEVEPLRIASDHSADGMTDVELALEPTTNLHLVRRTFRVGCGFEPRWARGFDRFVSPAEILVELAPAQGSDDEERGIVYRHAETGERLRFHYRGFLLTTFLPPEIRLLLPDAVDTWSNPFETPGRPDVESDALVREPGLTFGRVVLRRERFVFGAERVAELSRPANPRSDEPIRATAELRAAVHEATGRDEERWYYRATGTGGREHKSRFLDLANPLSVAGLRRDLDRLGHDGLLFLEAMAPTPENASPAGTPPRAHELMIETRGVSS